MTPTPIVNAQAVMRVLGKLGFVETRSRGSHRRFEHPDGRKATVPVHKGRDVPRGLLRRIVIQQMEITMDEFTRLL